MPPYLTPKPKVMRSPNLVYGLMFTKTFHKNWFRAVWSRGNEFVSGTGGLRFISRADQIDHSVANGSPPL